MRGRTVALAEATELGATKRRHAGMAVVYACASMCGRTVALAEATELGAAKRWHAGIAPKRTGY